ncbi:MAG TPA: beta-propeller fold lactonase family protein [Gemmatimonadales bacterium]|jgi:YVTN family beta-propeller protein|nr:beta-propeller fold lactonase family protein [Gemmatimonadales bacterium]
MKQLLSPLAALLLATALPAQTRDISLWVTLGDSDQLVELDAYSYRELRRITVDPRPHGLAITADGSKVYIASDKTGNFQVIDARSGRITGQIPIGNDPNQMTLSKDGRFAYVPMRGESKIAVVQLDPLRLLKKLPAPAGPHDAYTSADGSRIYIGAQYGSAITVIDPATQSVLHNIPTPAGARPLEPSEDGKLIYVALSKLLGFVVVDPATRQVTRRVELGTLPEGMPQPYKDTWTHGLQLANGGRELWLCDDINDLIRVVRLSDMQEVAQIRTGHFPHWFAMRPDGRVLFVSLWFSDAVAAIDVQSRKVVSNMQFELGSGPKRIAIGKRVPR